MNQTDEKSKIYLLCRYAMESGLYTSWIDNVPFPHVVVDECSSDWAPPADCGIVVTHEHYRWEEISALRRIYEQHQIPILILADGVLEYRNTWDNPTIPSASIYQPLMGHKIACIGRSSARIIESWGNKGKVEVVGLPRLDSLVEQVPNQSFPEGSTVLVTTATTPAFTPQQRAAVISALSDLKRYFESTPSVGGQAIDVVWRLTDGLYDEIGIDDPGEDQPSLAEAITSAAAVITTPSTIYLESVLLNRPTAIIDYSNSPPLTQSAWSITSTNHIEPTICELFDPPAPKLWYQTYCLHDNLACQTSATNAMTELIVQMISIANQQRSERKPLSLPDQILNSGKVIPETQYTAADCYEDLPETTQQDLERLQLELSEAKHRLGSLPRELADKSIQISQLQAALDESRRRVADVRARLFKLRKILGIGKENQTDEATE